MEVWKGKPSKPPNKGDFLTSLGFQGVAGSINLSDLPGADRVEHYARLYHKLAVLKGRGWTCFNTTPPDLRALTFTGEPVGCRGHGLISGRGEKSDSRRFVI